MDYLNYSNSTQTSLSKTEELQAYFTAIDTDLVENNQLVRMVQGSYAKKMARLLINQVPNLINTDLLSLKLLCELLEELQFIDKQLQEARKKENLMLYHKFYKLKLDGTSKAMSLIGEFGLTPRSRSGISPLALEVEED